MCIIGSIDGIVGQGVSGWVCRSSQLEERLWVELLVDNCPMGIALAENYHPGAQEHGDACYGFWLIIPPIAQESGSTIQVRVANTHEVFAPYIQLDEAQPASAILGELLSDMGLSVSGWAMDASFSDKKLHISAWSNGKKFTETIANGRQFRPEHADGHGFNLSLPIELADGAEHIVHIQDEQQRPVPGSPIKVFALPESGSTWLINQKQLSPQKKDFLISVLKNYELIFPKNIDIAKYSTIKKVFSVPSIPTKKNVNIGVYVDNTITKEALDALSRQEHVKCTIYTQKNELNNSQKLNCITGGLDYLWKLILSNHEFIVYMNGSDILHPKFLSHMVHTLQQHECCLVYADEELILPNVYPLPLHKPSWDKYFYIGYDYLGPILTTRDVCKKIENIKQQESALKTKIVIAAEESCRIYHIPLVLSSHNGQASTDERREFERRSVLQSWLQKSMPEISLESHPQHTFLSRICSRVNTQKKFPLISIIIPTRDKADVLKKCLDSLKNSTYPKIEILIVDNNSIENDALDLLQKEQQNNYNGVKTRVLQWPGYFNYAAINNYAAQEAQGELLCFLNNDTQIISPDWLEEMVGLILLDKDIGCVGAKLLWPNNLVQHGGVIVGIHGLAAHVGNQWLADEDGYMYRNLLIQQWSAVTAACLLTSKQLFIKTGGFDAVRFPVAFNDVDYCLRVRSFGKKIVWTPYACIAHYESASRGRDVSLMDKKRASKEMREFRNRWGTYDDPFYNPNLSLSVTCEPFTGLALPPRARSVR